MSERNFRQMQEKKWGDGKFVCVGLDSDYEKIPECARKKSIWETVLGFNLKIVDATSDIVHGYKLNPADYMPYGAGGLDAIWQTIANINKRVPDVPVILDGKYGGGIAKENLGYARYAFDYLKADAVTVYSYPGAEAMWPFLGRKDKGIFVICRTSGPGSNEFQSSIDMCGDMVPGDYMPPYKYIAHRVARYWNANGNCGLVVGANHSDELREVRQRVLAMPILSPAVGFQQKDIPLKRQVKQTVFAGRYSGRDLKMLFACSRSIIFASEGPDFAEAARRKTLDLHNLINQYR